MFQDLALCNNLDIVQNMFLGRERTNHGITLDEEAMEKSAAETLASLAVTTVRSIRQPVASLSGGQRQSVAIAKAVLWNTKLVIMDEPTAALGVAQTAMVLALVKRLADRGHAVMLVSHNMNDVFEVADRIAVLFLGRVVALLPAADLDRQIAVDLMTTGQSARLSTQRPRREGGRSRMSEVEDPTPAQTDTGEPDEPMTAAAARKAELALPPDIAADSISGYLRTSLARVKRRRERRAAGRSVGCS